MRISRLLALSPLCLASSPAIAQPAAPVSVQLSNFKFTPGTIVLDHGRPYVLHLVNVASGGHDFTAADFFAAANVTAADRGKIVDGVVEVPSGKALDIHLTAPVAGRYKLKCSHTLHKAFGMSGSIIVR